MSVRRHVVVAGVDNGLVPDSHLEHGRTQDVAGVVGLDLEVSIDTVNLGIETGMRSRSILDLVYLVKIHGNHFLHAVLDHCTGEEVFLSLLVDGDLAHVLQ